MPAPVVAQTSNGNLADFRSRVRQVLYFDVTGNTKGSVWGTDIYTDDSQLATTAVHAGVLVAGEIGLVKVVILPGQEAYASTERNGVTSTSYGSDSPITVPIQATAVVREPPSEAPKIAFRIQGKSLVIEWGGNGALQVAGQVNGPWTDLAGAASPTTINIDDAKKFYRIKQ